MTAPPDLTQVLLDAPVLEDVSEDLASADSNAHSGRTGAGGEPRCGDPRSVPRELRCRAVGIPDHDFDLVVAHGNDLDDAVGTGGEGDCAGRV